MSALVLDSKGHEEFPEAEVQAAVKKRRTAVERAEESLNKAKAKARKKLLKLAKDKLEEALHLLHGAGADITFPGDEYGLDLADSISAGIAAIVEEVGE